MDWDKALSRNTQALVRIVGALFVLLVSARLSGSGLMVPRAIWRSILLVLLPAESAVRRLIVIAARALVDASFTLRQRDPNGFPTMSQHRPSDFQTAPTFSLFDPLKVFAFSDDADPFGDTAAGFRQREMDDEPVNATPLHNRLRALRHALGDLAAQAARLARFNARRDLLLKAGRPVRLSLMRPGLPPGWRERGKLEIDGVLRECHALLCYLENPPDTS